MQKLKLLLGNLLLILLVSCNSTRLKTHVLPVPEDTFSKEISYQEKTSYEFDGIHVDNEFDGARMNGFSKVSDNVFRVVVSPENTPINASAYFAFRIWSERERNIELEIEYTEHEHRYIPKLSYDAVNWKRMDSTLFDTIKAPDLATLRLSLNADTLYVAAQELMTSGHNSHWVDSLARTHHHLNKSVAGTSTLGRDIELLDLNKAGQTHAIAIFSRLHPPEITGYMAMKEFVETLLEDNALARQFRDKFRILVYPMINPDGVDLGHWRHNVGGIDLNRDWSHYRQKETDVVANHLVDALNASGHNLVLGLDFHSTQEDIYYTLTDNRKSNIYGFKDAWIYAIDEHFDDYTPDDAPYDLNQPITKAWFYLQFDAEGITYEVGDETDRDFVKDKARVAALEMMKLLVLK